MVYWYPLLLLEKNANSAKIYKYLNYGIAHSMCRNGQLGKQLADKTYTRIL